MTLRLADAETRADLATYVARVRRLDEGGAMRLQASGRTLAAWAGVLSGRGLSAEGTALGLRVMALGEDADEDAVVPVAALGDRLAHAGSGTELDVPPTRVMVSWAAVSPPRSGWEQIGEVATGVLKDVAEQGISEIAAGAPEGSGAAAVESLRHRVWGRGFPAPGGADGLPAGAAFAAYALGFVVGDHAQVYAAGRWHRLSTPVGHVLVR
ncbi:hypothetical protein HJ588_09160 [Flexivirga sp. ID2601S]|uniref:Uncharacterized protein n=1 Tax=Flexivirga aerilata TaxID=1656889 RepID=A0A849AM50_9MICO|nr:hypothetical protein [Flexivirga aerilata]